MFAKKFLGAAASVALALGSGGALAAAPATNAFVNGTNNLSDDSGEIIIFPGAPGPIGVGARYVGIIGITSFPTSGVPVASVNELTGVFALEVVSVGPAGTCNSFGIAGPAAAMCNAVTYGPVADFNATVALVGLGPFTKLDGLTPLDSVGNPGTVGVIFEDPAQDFNRDGGGVLATALASAVGGIQRMTLTSAGAGTFLGVAPASLADIALFGPGANVGNFGGSLTVQEEGFPLADIGPTLLVSTGGQSAPTAGSAFAGVGVHDDATFVIDVTLVPEPAMLGLMGLGLLGLGAASRRRRSAA